MICKKCKSEWSTSSRFFNSNKCPFCGATLEEVKENQGTMETVVKQIFEQFGSEILLEKNKFLAVFADYAPKMKKERKMLNIALDEGVAIFFVNCAEYDRETRVNQAKKSMSLIMSETAIETVIQCFTFALGWESTQKTVSENNILPSQKIETNTITKSKTSNTIGIDIYIVPSVGLSATVAIYYGKMVEKIVGGSYATAEIEGIYRDGRETDANEIYYLIDSAKKHAEKYLPGLISEAFICVPSNFTRRQRELVKDACQRIDVKPHFVKKYISLIYHKWFCSTEDVKILVLNMQAQSCDIAVAEISEGMCEILAASKYPNFHGISFMSGNEWDEIMMLLYDSICQSKLQKDDLDEVILNGEILNEQVLVKYITNRFKCNIVSVSNSTIATANAKLKAMFNQTVDGLLVVDVLSESIGIETSGGVFTTIIPKNTTLPTKKTMTFSTYTNNQAAVDICLLRGQKKFARDNEKLGEFRFDGIFSAKAGVPQIEISIGIDKDENITLSARDITFPNAIRNLGVYHI